MKRFKKSISAIIVTLLALIQRAHAFVLAGVNALGIPVTAISMMTVAFIEGAIVVTFVGLVIYGGVVVYRDYITATFRTGSTASTHSNAEAESDKESQKGKEDDDPMPSYKVSPARDQKQGKIDPNKTPEPPDAKEVFKRSIPDRTKGRDSKGFWRVRYGQNANGTTYRFQSSNDGTFHFNGSTDSERGIEVPKDIPRALARMDIGGNLHQDVRNPGASLSASADPFSGTWIIDADAWADSWDWGKTFATPKATNQDGTPYRDNQLVGKESPFDKQLERIDADYYRWKAIHSFNNQPITLDLRRVGPSKFVARRDFPLDDLTKKIYYAEFTVEFVDG